MKIKNKKNKQSEFAKENLEFYFYLLDTGFNRNFDKYYVREILRFSQAFNIRLDREEKLKFCKNCHIYWDVNSRIIRLSKNGFKEYICLNCAYKRKFKLI